MNGLPIADRDRVKEVDMLLATLTTGNPVVYVIVKLCVLVLAVVAWWLVTSYPTHPVI
ncbi:hypothetical protein [Trichothermofontia sp.]